MSLKMACNVRAYGVKVARIAYKARKIARGIWVRVFRSCCGEAVRGLGGHTPFRLTGRESSTL